MNSNRDASAGAQQPYATVDTQSRGPLLIEEAPAGSPKRGRWALPQMQSGLKGGRIEQIALLLIAAAAVVLLLLFAGRVLPSVIGGIISGFYTAFFVMMLTLSNLRRPSGWANNILGRQVFPVLQAPDGQIWRLALVNSVLVFLFVFFFQVLASFITSLFAGMVVIGGLIALGIFYNRARTVIKRP